MMISILIPIFNYKVVHLVKNLYEQLLMSNIDFEVICFDDGSAKNYIDFNKSLDKTEYISYIVSGQNIGRTEARQKLALKAKYNWLLFLDADVIPKSNNFIATYLKYLNNNYQVINGGIAYEDQKPESDFLLRWKYGRQQEQKNAAYRNKKPCKIITSGNFLIDKDVFLSINSKIEQNTYGLDNIFGALLKSKKVNVFHIDNEVYHLGLETNATYLKKKENSAITVLNHHKTKKISEHQNDLLHLFIKLKRFRLNFIFANTYKIFGKTIQKILLGKNPSINLLQLYRISFMCYKDLYSK